MEIGRKKNSAGEGGRTLLESVVVISLVGIFVIIAVEKYSSSVKYFKEAALAVELSNLRSALGYYVTLNERLPASLKDLLHENIAVKKQEIEGEEYKIVFLGKYVERMSEDPEGYPLDPFGNRYGYDPGTGKISPTTRGYENW